MMNDCTFDDLNIQAGNAGDVLLGVATMIGGAVGLVTAPELAPAWLALYRAGAAMAITGGAIDTVAGFFT
ncbi:hypothetical protein [Alicyclobacillus acidocaldarius]|uniref:hypothetical protein n=1 Tax=Alicyclobacillus acidocaldarius TaxID=405212 RepID=UPI00019DD120|nr:hypothetical protein [Alicyclobacillus acidocaldarius]